MIKVAVLFGGFGSEHEVSISSAKNILENIDREAFDVVEVFVTKDLKYDIDGVFLNEESGLREIKNRNIDIVFPIFHGMYGEGGILQKKLEGLGIPFIGSSSSVSSLAINKHKTNKVLSKNNIATPKESLVTRENHSHICTYPIIVKPVHEGSSVGLYKYENEIDYLNSLETTFKAHSEMLVQEFIQGREFTCGVIEKDGIVTPLLATEVVLTKGVLFDYEAKYTPRGCEEITPAKIDASLMEKIQNTAIDCHKIIGCSSLSRTDMILKDNQLYVLEINTMPGMTETSFIPAQAKASGHSMKELITILIYSVKLS